MAWVSVHDNVIGKKLRELTKELGTTQEEALGVLVSLWLWGLNNADKEGKIVGADKGDILEAFSIKVVANHEGEKIVDAGLRILQGTGVYRGSHRSQHYLREEGVRREAVHRKP